MFGYFLTDLKGIRTTPQCSDWDVLEDGGIKTLPLPPHPTLPLISLPVESDCNKFLEAMQREYLSSPHAIVCEVPFTKAKQLLPWDMLHRIM